MTSAAAEPAVEDHVSLAAGEAATIEIDAGGAVAVTTLGASDPLTEHQVNTERAVTSGAYGAASGENHATLRGQPQQSEATPIQPNVLRLRFMETPDHHMVLSLENGYPQGLRYHATIRRGDRSHSTDVCTLPPNFRGYESWSYHLDSLELSGITLFPWTETSQVTCQE